MPVEDMLTLDGDDEEGRRLEILQTLVAELRKAWPLPGVHGIDAPQLEIDLVWELMSPTPSLKPSTLPDIGFPSHEELAEWDRTPEVGSKLRAAYGRFHTAIDDAAEILGALKGANAKDGVNIDHGRGGNPRKMKPNGFGSVGRRLSSKGRS